MTIWAAKKLGKTLPDEEPERASAHVQAAIYPPALEEGQGHLLDSDTSMENDLTQKSDVQKDTMPKAHGEQPISAPIPETIDNTPPLQSEETTMNSQDEDQDDPHEPDDENPTKTKFMTRVKTLFGKMVPKPDDDLDDAVDIEELPEEEYITADQYVAISESDALKGQTAESSTLLRSDYSPPSYDNVPLSQTTTVEQRNEQENREQ